MNDMTKAIVPKSDQLNSDDLIAGPRTIKVSKVAIKESTEQPVSIFFDGDNGKPYKPCKSMSRVLVQMWGPDANKYVGRSMTLYRDPEVTWAGMKVGGIRISHMSDIPGEKTMALTATKQSKKPFTVKPLTNGAAQPPTAKEWLAEQAKVLSDATEAAQIAEWQEREKAKIADLSAKQKEWLDGQIKIALERISNAPPVEYTPGADEQTPLAG
jgi:hypothetical protein